MEWSDDSLFFEHQFAFCRGSPAHHWTHEYALFAKPCVGMSRQERSVRGLADWMLRLILLNPFMRGWHDAVHREIHRRDVEGAVEETVDDRYGPWRCAPPEGMV